MSCTICVAPNYNFCAMNTGLKNRAWHDNVDTWHDNVVTWHDNVVTWHENV